MIPPWSLTFPSYPPTHPHYVPVYKALSWCLRMLSLSLCVNLSLFACLCHSKAKFDTNCGLRYNGIRLYYKTQNITENQL